MIENPVHQKDIGHIQMNIEKKIKKVEKDHILLNVLSNNYYIIKDGMTEL